MRMTRKSVADHQTGLDCVLFIICLFVYWELRWWEWPGNQWRIIREDWIVFCSTFTRERRHLLCSLCSAPHRENRDWENILRPLPPPLRWKFRRCRTTRGGCVNRKIGSNALHGQIWSECVIYAVTNMYNVRLGLARCHNMLCVTCCHDQIKATICSK